YQQLSYYLMEYPKYQPGALEGWPGITFDAAQMAKDVDERVIQPTKAASKLFDDFSIMTRLYTTLSPQDMTLDPVFSYNSKLPYIANEHAAVVTYYCGYQGTKDQFTTPARLVTEQGWAVDYPDGTGPTPTVPQAVVGATGYAARVEILKEEGMPNVVSQVSKG